MRLLSSVAALSFLPLIHAQSGNGMTTATSSSSSSASAPSGTGTVHRVDVGEDGLSFTPASLNVPVGDKIEFHFYPPAHLVAQSTFANPCSPIKQGGFYSGVVSTSGKSETTFTVTVNNTDPIWYYCGVGQHCQAGMVGVINPPSGGKETIEAFKSAASQVQDSSTPANAFGGVLGTSTNQTTSSRTTDSISNTATSASATKTSAGASSPSTTPNAGVSVQTVGGMSSLVLLGVLSWIMV
ncbi:hypothetical protein N7539_005403 [Penicillium diatomitis]|uniref:Phytocyanin domain-containing protein n=1 Tax=Penicillium diatomitis TaxID=2819901 RepID=A0A9X0BV87_9EURO|nr:uncharacterized protein N7539_005403 [Penicillium diatomitis]KAJ5485415.1 hypothetical protein N7539_005403 [Penicillium diatomitis]